MIETDEEKERQARLEKAINSQWLAAKMALQGYESNGLMGWKYTGDHDAAPLAAMLVTGLPVPKEIAKLLGVVLDPQKEWRDARFKLIKPPKRRSSQALWQDLIRKTDAREDYRRLKSDGKPHKQAVYELQIKYDVKRTWVEDAIAMDDEQFVRAGVEGLSSRKRGSKRVRQTDPKLAD